MSDIELCVATSILTVLIYRYLLYVYQNKSKKTEVGQDVIDAIKAAIEDERNSKKK